MSLTSLRGFCKSRVVYFCGRRANRRTRTKWLHVTLYFLKLPDAEFAIRRVAHRVRLGGHAVPEKVIRRRFDRGWKLLNEVYIPLVDEWAVYDASQTPPAMLEERLTSNAESQNA